MCFDDFDEPEFCTTDIRRARKPHRCCECRKMIEPGTLYECVSGKWEGELETFRTCPSCFATRQAVVDAEIREGCPAWSATPPFGGLMEFVNEYDPPVVCDINSVTAEYVPQVDGDGSQILFERRIREVFSHRHTVG